MKWEEAIEQLENLLGHCESMANRDSHVWDADCRALKLAIAALRPVSREPLEKFKEYFDDLYGKGLEVYGWHMNGEAKSFDDFYEDACEYAGL